MANVLKKLRLKADTFVGFKNGERHTFVKGDQIELTASQATCFADQFEDPRILKEAAEQAAREQVIADKEAAELNEATKAEQAKLEAEQLLKIRQEEIAVMTSEGLMKALTAESDPEMKKLLSAEVAKRKAGK